MIKATLSIALAVLSTLLSLPAIATTYKCAVDGKTTYQETPCADSRGTQSVIAVPSRKVEFGSSGSASRSENKNRDAVVKSDLEPRAREAFAAIKGGQTMAYRDMLCVRSRQVLSNPAMANSLKDAAADYTKRDIQIDSVSSSSSNGVSFKATHKDTGSKKSMGQRFVHVHFDWDDGKPCVTHIDAF